MNPAIILVCTTLVTNAASGTVATKSCSAEHAPIILAAANMAQTLPVPIQFEMTSSMITPRHEPVAEVVVQKAQPKRMRVAAYMPRHRHHHLRSRIRVIPTANELTPQKPMSFWDKLKALPDQISKSITID